MVAMNRRDPKTTACRMRTGRSHMALRIRMWLTGLCATVLLSLMIGVSPAWATSVLVPGDTNTSIAALSSAGTLMDGQKVDFTGEAVGDIVNGEKGYKWLTLYDGGSSVSVYVSDEDALKVSNLGRYGQKGTSLEISGVFNLACDIHEGLSDVHASRVKVLEAGESQPSQLNVRQLQIGLLLVGIGALLLLLHWRLRERTR